ncbi:hypothetical protein FISHEDRAFT_74861 [Fistulina hepatica ATCC 64428]|uniref:Uncharacterized protein n=1 Tax=Fistulina hepatica ATCC 64428 TaxID=1128425 RepID=A0A0D7A888_9AGAR|nr:hypothetical protein FISHEDRAFT_74861 [Fistulina hepatica ATCC 64428]
MQGLPSPRLVGDGPFRDPSEVWGSKYNKKGGDAYPNAVMKDGAGSEQQGLIVNDAPKEVEEVPSSRSRRTWLWTTWALTWWIPNFLLSSLGRMKRPDIRLACFSKLLCPDYDKAWNEEGNCGTLSPLSPKDVALMWLKGTAQNAKLAIFSSLGSGRGGVGIVILCIGVVAWRQCEFTEVDAS